MLPLRETEKKKKSVERRGSIIMPQKQKNRVEEKIRIVQKYLRRDIGLREAAREVGVHHETIKKWASRYENEGAGGFLYSSNRIYDRELKGAFRRDAAVQQLSGLIDFSDGTP